MKNSQQNNLSVLGQLHNNKPISFYKAGGSIASDSFFPLLCKLKYLRGEVFQDYITALELHHKFICTVN